MNWNFLLYSSLSLITSVGLYIQNKRWISQKKKNGDLGSFDKGNAIYRNWLLIFLFACIGIVYFFKFLFNL
ncbi:hypothetical protein FHT21_002325 [Pedobacter sp. SG908]|nr:hypothetical protein [Pedobacter sp. SG908]NMN37150.1 hypothetical protein [Pedobacter sp. SG918]